MAKFKITFPIVVIIEENTKEEINFQDLMESIYDSMSDYWFPSLSNVKIEEIQSKN